MRKSTVFAFALCGTLLLVLLAVSGRLIYMNVHTQSLEKIIGSAPVTEITLSENGTPVRTLHDAAAIGAVTDVLGAYTYVEYPHFFSPSDAEKTGSLLTVSFSEDVSIGVNAEGYVFVNDKLRDVEGGRGKEFYHKLYVLTYPASKDA